MFVSSSAKAAADPAIALLRRAGLTPVTWSDVPTAAASATSVSSALRASSALIAYLEDPDAPPAGVLVEVGVAIGLGKRVILLIPDSRRRTQVAPTLSGLPTVWLGADLDRVAARLIAYLSAPSDPSVANPAEAAPSKSMRSDLARPWNSELEARVGRALEVLGAHVAPQVPANTLGEVDMAAWVSFLDPVMNPVLVEVLGLSPHVPHVSRGQERLRAHLHAVGSQIGFLITAEDRQPTWDVVDAYAILTLGLPQLERLAIRDFEQLLVQGRNKLFHAR